MYRYDIDSMKLIQGEWHEDGVLIDERYVYNDETVQFTEISLPAWRVCRVVLEYETDTDFNFCTITDNSPRYENLLSNGSSLYAELHNTDYEIQAKIKTLQLVLAWRRNFEWYLLYCNCNDSKSAEIL